jgi:hypothetical protein
VKNGVLHKGRREPMLWITMSDGVANTYRCSHGEVSFSHCEIVIRAYKADNFLKSEPSHRSI